MSKKNVIDSLDDFEVSDFELEGTTPEATKVEKDELDLEDIPDDILPDVKPPEKPVVSSPVVADKPKEEEVKLEQPSPVLAEKPVVEETPIVEKPKRGRPASKKAKSTEPEIKVELRTTPFGVFHPEFKIENILTSKYQNRQNKHNETKTNELIESLKIQGQIEPVHILKESDGTFQLMAGFGRIAAMKNLGFEKCKAMVYENLNSDTIIKIVCGTNIGRSELTEWDKIVSVGTYKKENPLASIETMCSAFGFQKSKIYLMLEHYSAFGEIPEFQEYFNTHVLSPVTFNVLTKNKDKILKYKTEILESLNGATRKEAISAKNFERSLNAIFKFNEDIDLEDVDLEKELEIGDIDVELIKDVRELSKELKLDDNGRLIIEKNSIEIGNCLEKCHSLLTEILQKDPLQVTFKTYRPQLKKRLEAFVKMFQG